jgi:predicted transcriptional regulator
MSEATLTLRVEETLKNDFANAAKSRDRTSAQLIRDFMREYINQQSDTAAHDAWFRQQVQRGIESANAGNLIPAADVEAHFAARRAATRRRLDAPIA